MPWPSGWMRHVGFWVSKNHSLSVERGVFITVRAKSGSQAWPVTRTGVRRT